MMLFTTLVVSLLVCCEVQLGWSGVRVAGSSTTELCLSLQPGHHSSLTSRNLQHTANQEQQDQCGKQHHSRELLMLSIVILETC